ncbi:MAG: GNAT family N-acetyltransferase [Gammaproteobacteria bacterium]|nr:GNAT family N-acetyltransferase [Gammaproteobacteria bacterium]
MQMTDQILIRPALRADLPSLVDIYNHYVRETPVTFDTDPFTVDAREAWFSSFSKDGPHRLLVATRGGAVRGYASSTCFKARKAYDVSVETTIYLDPGSIGSGIGFALYGALVAELIADPRLHRAYGGIALPNDASVALHEKLGFEHVGTYREVGRKFDRYWDVAWFEKDLSGAS